MKRFRLIGLLVVIGASLMSAGGASAFGGHGFGGGHFGGGGFHGGGFGHGGYYGGYGYYGGPYVDPDAYDIYGYGYGYGQPDAYGAPLQTGRSAAEAGDTCQTPIKACHLSNASVIGQKCSCKTTRGRSAGHVTP